MTTQAEREHAILILARPGFVLPEPRDLWAILELQGEDDEISDRFS